MSKLQIVIPYYKRRFLRQALESLAHQTSRDFSVFIGDDASPETPDAVIADFSDTLRITYHRFEQNLGARSLPKQWDRCVRMTSADWVWLFSDDDIAEAHCVESFIAELEFERKFDVYRFEKQIINDNGDVTSNLSSPPQVETAEELVLARFSESRSITVPEHIFARSAFDRDGGFVDFPVAWFSDDASWASFARITGVKTISGGMVLWRTGEHNLSKSDHQVSAKVKAFGLYLRWLKTHFPNSDFQSRLIPTVRAWAPMAMSWMARFIPLTSLLIFWRDFSSLSGRLDLRQLQFLIRHNSWSAYCIRRLRARATHLFKR